VPLRSPELDPAPAGARSPRGHPYTGGRLAHRSLPMRTYACQRPAPLCPTEATWLGAARPYQSSLAPPLGPPRVAASGAGALTATRALTGEWSLAHDRAPQLLSFLRRSRQRAARPTWTRSVQQNFGGRVHPAYDGNILRWDVLAPSSLPTKHRSSRIYPIPSHLVPSTKRYLRDDFVPISLKPINIINVVISK
jgi:hypothetical protein